MQMRCLCCLYRDGQPARYLNPIVLFYTRSQLMHRLKKLLYKIFSPRRLMLRCEILSCTCTDTSCCVPRPYILHAQTPDGLWKDLLLYLHTCTDAWVWCYVKRSSLVLAQTLDARAGGVPSRRPGPYISVHLLCCPYIHFFYECVCMCVFMCVCIYIYVYILYSIHVCIFLAVGSIDASATRHQSCWTLDITMAWIDAHWRRWWQTRP